MVLSLALVFIYISQPIQGLRSFFRKEAKGCFLAKTTLAGSLVNPSYPTYSILYNIYTMFGLDRIAEAFARTSLIHIVYVIYMIYYCWMDSSEVHERGSRWLTLALFLVSRVFLS